MACRFGHEVPELTHRLDADLLVDVIPRFLAVGAEERIEILARGLVGEGEKPCHMVDAGTGVLNLFFGPIGVAGNQIHGGLDAVAETDKVDPIGQPAQSQAAGCHGVCVVQEKGMGTELFHILHQFGKNRHGPQAPHHSARAERIANALVDSVLHRDLVVMGKGSNAPHLDHADHIVGIFERLPPV